MKAQVTIKYINGLLQALGIDFNHLGGRERTRVLVRIRDGFTCQSCGDFRSPLMVQDYNKKLKTEKGKIKSFDVHHLNGECGKNSRGYDDVESLDGLVTLCHKCHFGHHQFSQKEVWTASRLDRAKVQKAIKDKNGPVFEELRTKASIDLVEMKEVYENEGLSLRKIGERYGISGERVRQKFVSIGYTQRNIRVKKPKVKPQYSYTCAECKKPFTAFNRIARYCSAECRATFRHRYSLKRTRDWYYAHKDLPEYQKLIAMRNKGKRGISINDLIKK